MNKNVLIVLAGGFLIAILVALIVQSGLKGSKEQVPTAEVPQVEILVASADLKLGTTLSDNNMRWQKWPENNVFPGAIVREETQAVVDAVSGRVKREISKDEPIMKNALVEDTKENFLAAALDEGMRAVAIDVEASTMVGGFINPGDFVDVLLTYQVKIKGVDAEESKSTVNKFATETILENVKILAIDQRSSKGDEDKAKVGRTVTLAVQAEAAEILALATRMGDLSLSLRPIGDETSMANKPITTDVRVSRVMQQLTSSEGGAPSSASHKKRTDIVRVYSGSNVQNIPVRSLHVSAGAGQ